MTGLAIAASVLGLVAAAGCGTVLLRLRPAPGRLERALSRQQARLTEAQICARARRAARDQRQQVAAAVDLGTDSVEALHRAVADLGFELFGDECGKEHHDRSADVVYDSVREIRRRTSSWLDRLLDPPRR